MALLSIRLLGTFQVSKKDVPCLNFESNKVRALLAYLAVENRHAHSREKLIGLFWPELPARRASSNLSQAIYNLSMVIDDRLTETPYLLRTRRTVQFNPDSDYWLDVQAFRTILAEDKPIQELSVESNPDFYLQIQAAIDLYQGDFLEDLGFDSNLAFDEWVMVTRHRLQRQVIKGLQWLVNFSIEKGEFSKALDYAWRQIEIDPLDESACRQLMNLLASNGQRNQALAQFERFQTMLAEELNVPPSPETFAVYNRILNEAPSSGQSKKRANNLPAFLTPMIGRRRELAELNQRLKQVDCRLLTILGPGGSGKTRLALEVARASQDSFSDGVYFVPLDPVQSPTSILPAIVDAIAMSRQGQDDLRVQINHFLRDKHILLVLDGFERLLEGATILVELLHQAAGLKILVTSRIRINIKGEQLYRLSGMDCPTSESTEAEILEAEAVQLFLTGLGRVRPEFKPMPAETGYLHQICRRVQGMPLGILLAATWGATLSLEEIAGEVSLDLDLLSTDWADIPERQRSLRATFDHTWVLLGGRHRSIFQCLSMFRGPFTLQSARKVCGASLTELRALVDRSMLSTKSPGWFEMHELLRQYGMEKLGLSPETEQKARDRHNAYYFEQLGHLGVELKSAQQSTALTKIDLEHENYRAAWNWSVAQTDVIGLGRVLESLCLYYELRLRFEDGESACQAAIGTPVGDQVSNEVWLLRGRIKIWQSRFTRLLGNPGKAFKLLDQAVSDIQKAKDGLGQVHDVEAFLYLESAENNFLHDRAASAEFYQRSLQIYRQIGDAWGTTKALSGLGFIAHHAGRFKEAVEFYSECLHLHRTLADPRGIANATVHLGQNMLRQGLVKKGEYYIHEGVSILQQIGDLTGVARGWFELARYYFWTGEFEKSCELTAKASDIFKHHGILDQFIFASIGLGLGLSHRGKYAEAIDVAMKGIPAAQELDTHREIGLAQVILGMGYLGQNDFKQAAAWAQKSVQGYRELNQQEELTLALAILVYAERGLGNREQARVHLREILQIGCAIHGIYPILYILLAVALFLMDRGEIERSLEISTLARGYPFVNKSRWFEDIGGRELSSAAEILPPRVVIAARERGCSLDLWDLVDKLLHELGDDPVCS